MINPTKHTLPCQFLIKLGMLQYATTSINEAIGGSFRDESRGWFEGFVTGLHEASVIDDKTYDDLIDEISRIGLTFETPVEFDLDQTLSNEHIKMLIDFQNTLRNQDK